LLSQITEKTLAKIRFPMCGHSTNLDTMRIFRILAAVLALCGLAACAADPAVVKAEFDRGLAAYDTGDFAAAFGAWDAIKDDDLAALRNVATMLRTGKGVAKNPAEAEKLMAYAADAGMVKAAYDLGEMLLDGEAGPPDVKAGVFWLTNAADAGHPLAAFRLGLLYQEGTLLPRDIERARKYYRTAADAGLTEAADMLKSLQGP
jgi:uncharacterized protein